MLDFLQNFLAVLWCIEVLATSSNSASISGGRVMGVMGVMLISPSWRSPISLTGSTGNPYTWFALGSALRGNLSQHFYIAMTFFGPFHLYSGIDECSLIAVEPVLPLVRCLVLVFGI